MTDRLLSPIAIDEIDIALRNDLDAPVAEFTAWEHVMLRPDGYVNDLNSLHVVHHKGARRGGVVLVGSGSSGLTAWTDAATPEEVLRRYLADDMVA